MPRSSRVPKAYQNAVHDSGLPERVQNIMIDNYGDYYGTEQRLEEMDLPFETQRRILELLAEGSGAKIVDER